jgi:pimeloyl-ACP methyl ester carboxylesterase
MRFSAKLLVLISAALLCACADDTRVIPASVEQWRQAGRIVEVAGRKLFVVEQGSGPETLVILHGYPTSSHDFARVLPELAKRYRVVVHDHLGFGLSDKPADYSYSLVEQADLALLLWRALDIERAHLLAHDYGTSVATEILARREHFGLPLRLDTVTLCNGSVHIELARLRSIQRVLANPWLGPLVAPLSSRTFFDRQMRDIWADPSKLSDDDLAAMWALLIRDDGRRRLPAISGYLHERRRFWQRWIGALTRLDVPAHVLWAREDPIAVAAIAERLAGEIPGAKLSWLDGVGHYPMLEAPERWARAALQFWDDTR